MSIEKTNYEDLRKVMSVSGDVIVKCKCAGEVRRIPINQVPTYDELCFMMHRLFRTKLSASIDNLILRYTDEDGDLVSITDDLDISHAVSRNNVLRVTVFDKEILPLPPSDDESLTSKLSNLGISKRNLSALRQELTVLRDKLAEVIDALPEENKTVENGVNGIDDAKEMGQIKLLSTADMAEFLGKPPTIPQAEKAEIYPATQSQPPSSVPIPTYPTNLTTPQSQQQQQPQQAQMSYTYTSSQPRSQQYNSGYAPQVYPPSTATQQPTPNPQSQQQQFPQTRPQQYPQNPVQYTSTQAPSQQYSQPQQFTPQTPQPQQYTPQTPQPQQFNPQTAQPQQYAPQTPQPQQYAPQTPQPQQYTPQTPQSQQYPPQTPGPQYQQQRPSAPPPGSAPPSQQVQVYGQQQQGGTTQFGAAGRY